MMDAALHALMQRTGVFVSIVSVHSAIGTIKVMEQKDGVILSEFGKVKDVLPAAHR